MIEKDDLLPVGKFQRTHALKGELNALLDIDPEYFEEENPLIVDMDGIMVPFYLDTVRPKGASSFLIKLDGVDSEESARQFVNKAIYAGRESLSEFIGEEYRIAEDMEGYRVIDETLGELGVLSHIDDSTENALLVVDTPDGGELLIPAVDDFILSVDDDNATVFTAVPQGLIDLNSSKTESVNSDED